MSARITWANGVPMIEGRPVRPSVRPSVRESLEERAAILEYCAGYTRADAERMAVTMWRRRQQL